MCHGRGKSRFGQSRPQIFNKARDQHLSVTVRPSPTTSSHLTSNPSPPTCRHLCFPQTPSPRIYGGAIESDDPAWQPSCRDLALRAPRADRTNRHAESRRDLRCGQPGGIVGWRRPSFVYSPTYRRGLGEVCRGRSAAHALQVGHDVLPRQPLRPLFGESPRGSREPPATAAERSSAHRSARLAAAASRTCTSSSPARSSSVFTGMRGF